MATYQLYFIESFAWKHTVSPTASRGRSRKQREVRLAQSTYLEEQLASPFGNVRVHSRQTAVTLAILQVSQAMLDAPKKS